MSTSKIRKYNQIALSLTAAGLAWASTCWGYFYFQMKQVEARRGGSAFDLLSMPEGRSGFSSRWSPFDLDFVFNTSGSGLWWALAGVVIVLGFWILCPKTDTAPPWTWASVLSLPFFLGLSRIPSGIREVARMMSEMGLSDPGIFGSGVAEVSAGAWLGVLFGIDLLIVFLVWRWVKGRGPLPEDESQ